MKLLFVSFSLIFATSLFAQLPSAPTDAQHPGSKIYSYGFKSERLNCNGRDVDVFVPQGKTKKRSNANYPAIVFGHGQALDVDNYRLSMEHLAKKGIVAVFPTYDKGFFDRDWRRMGRDYVNLTDCAFKQIKTRFGVDTSYDQVVFSGHSKGAYVASIASGLSYKEEMLVKPRAIVLFQAAGLDIELNQAIDPMIPFTVVYSDKDTIVSRQISNDLFSSSPSIKKQFILLKSYPELSADHFWPLTKGAIFGGGPESSLHYFALWKWLVAAAKDLTIGGQGNNPYLYGDRASDKGITTLVDEISRNW